MEDDVTAEEGGVDVDAGAAETEDIGVDMDLEMGMLAGLVLVVGHVVAVARTVVVEVGELWWRREDGIWVKWPQSSMEGGVESVFLLGRGRRRGTVKYIRHGGEKNRTNKKQKKGRRKEEGEDYGRQVMNSSGQKTGEMEAEAKAAPGRWEAEDGLGGRERRPVTPGGASLYVW